MKFPIGALVRKKRGYRYPGIVLARFHTMRGKERYVVECMVPEVAGMLHIFGPNDLEYDRECPSTPS